MIKLDTSDFVLEIVIRLIEGSETVLYDIPSKKAYES